MRTFRIVSRQCLLILHALLGIALELIVWPFIGLPAQNALIRWWSRVCLRICGIGLEVVAADGAAFDVATLSGSLVLANHTSWLDIYVINAIRPAHFVAKSELRDWPLLGLLITRCGTIFIERGKRHAVHDVIKKIVAKMQAGAVCAVFPEGTTTDGTHLLPFHANLVQAALDAQAPIVPMAIRYLDHGAPSTRAAYIGDDTLLDSQRKVLGASGLVARIEVCSPITPPHATTRHQLAQQARESIAARLPIDR